LDAQAEDRFMPQPHKNLRRDLGVFADPGFLVTIVLLLLIFAAATALLIYGTSVHSVPLRLFS
jgi:hypothetical protein